MNLSFKSKSNSKSKPKPSQNFTVETLNSDANTTPNHQYVTVFDSSQTLAQQNPPEPNLIIPPKENEWRPHKKMKNLDLPSIRSAEGKPLEFEMEKEGVDCRKGDDPGSEISYGLNVRDGGKGGENGGGVGSIDAILVKKLRNDLDKLPEDEGFDQFDEVPVEGFAEALLAGYGWKKGQGIGKNAKKDVKIVEYKKRTSKEGLGFVGDHSVDSNVGERKTKGDREGGDGNVGLAVGNEVRIVRGREMGSKGRVVEVLPGGGSLVLRVSESGEEVNVDVSDVAELGSVEEERCLRELKELKIRGSKDEERRRGRKGKDGSETKESKRSRGSDRRGDVDEIKRKRGDREERGTKRVSWLRSHIRVRIVSKEFKRGRFYLKKGEVVDVVGPTTCDLSMDDGREIIQGVDQGILETALPRRGGPVLVLFGKHKGAYGNLVEKDSEKETGVVQDADTREMLHVRLEQIAEYVGDPSYIGY